MSDWRRWYRPDEWVEQAPRWQALIAEHRERFGEPVVLCAAPGRTELGGNHTDHNHGRVLAASIQLDTIAAATPSNDDQVEVVSEGYRDLFVVSLADLSPQRDEEGRTEALVRGVAAALSEDGHRVGGFRATITSNVMPGGGLSSSAALEILLGTVFSELFNDGTLTPLAVAQAGWLAENRHFGKPCGLMDQIACATRGVVAIDFADPTHPIIEQVEHDFGDYDLLVVATGGNHADLTEDYAAIPREMKAVARALGHEVCRTVDKRELLQNAAHLRNVVGDRAVLRALHFLGENERVVAQQQALRDRRLNDFLRLVRASGDSSAKLLQNSYAANPREQGIALALALTEDFLGLDGACRVHGGGFAGTIQAYVPKPRTNPYIEMIEGVFGSNVATVLRV